MIYAAERKNATGFCHKISANYLQMFSGIWSLAKTKPKHNEYIKFGQLSMAGSGSSLWIF